MKKYFVTISFFLFLSIVSLFGQSNLGNTFNQTLLSPTFGKDIVIDNDSLKENIKISVCSSFNGNLYCAIAFLKNGNGSYQIFKSIDSGINWIKTYEEPPNANLLIEDIKILTLGNTIENSRIFLGLHTNTPSGFGGAFVLKFKEEPFQFEEDILNDWSNNFTSLSIAGDYNENSNDFKIGVLYSKKKQSSNNNDSVIFRFCNNIEGVLGNSIKIDLPTDYTDNVSLDYGKSLTYPNGRFFAGWETKSNFDKPYGHIYTSHSLNDLQSAFSLAVCLDSLDSSLIDSCSNPKICSQYGDADNDSSNITQIIIFERSNFKHKTEIQGFYNLQSIISNYFVGFHCSDTSSNNIQPSICFDKFNKNFLLTYFDSSNVKLPLIKNNVNLINPSSWTFITDRYNDTINLTQPVPSIFFNDFIHSSMQVWVADPGITQFDYETSNYTSINQTISTELAFNAFPNPCNESLNISFLDPLETYILTIIDNTGKLLLTEIISAKESAIINTSKYLNGIYLCNLNSNKSTHTRKFIVSH